MWKPVIAFLLAGASLCVQASPRDTININFGWQFHRGDVADISSLCAVSSETVNLPHDFQISQDWVTPEANESPDNSDAGSNVRSRLSSRGFKEMGVGWYRYKLTPNEEWKGKRVMLDFQGIMLVGDVYLNGERIGGTDYGYLGFDIDISKLLNYGEVNEIAVRADTRNPNNSRWYTGGGLFRDVNLIISNSQTYFPRHPLYIRTENNDRVCIRAEITCLDKVKDLNVGVRILDAGGNVVAEQTERLPFNASWRQREYDLKSIALPHAHLWSVDTPNLYTAEVSIYDEQGTMVDRTTENFGVRTIEFSPEFGLKVNGQKVLLKGYANHHTLGALGAAAFPRAIEKRLRLIKEFGFNHVRTSHNPYSEDFLHLCDRLGLLVVDELYDKWLTQYAGGRTEWENLWQKNVPEFVRRDRNHPSVIMWSLGNELQQYANLPFNDWGVTAYTLQRELLRRYDVTRPVTVAMHPRYRSLESDSVPAPLALATDIASYNYRYMYFDGDGRHYPHMMFYQSEASTAAMGSNFFGMNRDKVLGLAYWGAIDYLGESQGWPLKGWDKGVFDISLQPKPNAYFVRSFFSEEPVVHIGIIEKGQAESMWNGINIATGALSENWNRVAGDTVSLYTYTNADEVELMLNGKSLGTKPNSTDPNVRNRIKWDRIPYAAGRLEAVARKDGKVVSRHALLTTGEATALQLLPDAEKWKADGRDLMHIRIMATDQKGNRVLAANDHLSFAVKGDASIVAVDNGNMSSEELMVGNSRRLYAGSALVILRAGRNAGEVTFTVTSDKFKPKSIKLKMGQ